MFNDPVLNELHKKVLAEFGELRPITARNPEHYFQALVESIVGQQLATKAAAAIRQKVRAAVGKDFSPATVLALPFENLRAAGLSNAKTNYVRNIATAWTDGTISVADLQELDDESLIAELTQIKGVGRWTAEMFLIFTLGRTDVFSVGDYGLKKGIIKAYSLPVDIKPAELLELSENWKPNRSLASLILWQSLELPETK